MSSSPRTCLDAAIVTFTTPVCTADTTRQSLYVTYNGKVYDLTPFLADHPGGDDVIVEYAGKDVGAIMGDANSHVHSRSAYEMMDEYKVGELGGDEKIVSEGEYRA